MFQVGITAPGARFNCSTIDAIAPAAETGVDGIEFFDWEGTDLEAVATKAADNDLDIFGTLAAGAGSTIGDESAPALVRPGDHEEVVRDIERSIEATARFDGSTLIVTVGPEQSDLDRTVQHLAIVDALRAVAPVAEANDVTVVVEPLNVRVDHPGYYLRTTGEGVEIVDAVDSSHVKLLFDVYHQQITEGDVIRRMRDADEYIGLVHIADNPGRHEPGTGELNYLRIFEAIAELEFSGYVSFEFSPTESPDNVFRDVLDLANQARDR